MLNPKTSFCILVALWTGMIGMSLAGCAPSAGPTPPSILPLTPTIPVQSIPTSTVLPTIAPTPTATPNLASTVAACQPAAQVTDMTKAGNSPIRPGETFTKTWRFLNSGTCAWEKGSALVFQSGEKLSAPEAVSFDVVDVGKSVDVSMTMQAPQSLGTYAGLWALQQSPGQIVAVAVVSITVSAPPPTRAPTVIAPIVKATARPSGGSIPPVGSGGFSADQGASGPWNCVRVSETEWVGEFYIAARGGPGSYTISDPEHCQWDFSQQRFVCRLKMAFTGTIMLVLQVSCPGCQPQDVKVSGRGQLSVNGKVTPRFEGTCPVPPGPWGLPEKVD